MAVPRLDYEFERVFNRRIPKFGIDGTEYRLRVSDVPVGLHYLLVADLVHDVLERVLLDLLYTDDGIARYPHHHRVRLSLMAEGLDHEIWIPFVPPAELTVDRVMVSVEKVLQSKKEWLFSGPMTVMFVHAPLPSGGGGGARPRGRLPSRTSEFLRLKRALVRIPNDEYGMCCARAIVVALAHARKHPKYDSLRRHSSVDQRRLALTLMTRAGLDPSLPCGFPEWEVLQKVLGPRWSLVIVSKDLFDRIVYYGNPEAKNRICLYHIDSHYHVISKLPAFFGERYVCPHCLSVCRSKVSHTCSMTCHYCRKPGTCIPDEMPTICPTCNMTYPNLECFNRHITEGFCETRRRCQDCGRVHMTYRKHACGVRLCPRCKHHRPLEHQCYMEPLTVDRNEGKRRQYIFYDFESMMVDGGRHVPNLCVAHKVCTLCMELPMDDPAVSCDCNRERVIFQGETALEQFGEYVMNGRRKAICIAHNSSAYDGQFLLAYVHSRGVKPKLILAGRKIMCLDAFGVRFVDSLNFFPMALSKLPKAFGVEELRKGYFPHLFNVPQSWEYIGPMPDADYYGPEQMSTSARQEFLSWYETQRDKTFCFRDELVSYCISDVDILQRCCGVFRKLFVEYTGLEPFTKSITIASACNRVYRTHYLQSELLALIPPEGVFKGRQSAIALCWLECLVRDDPDLRITHYGNAGEQRVCGRMVDGVGSDGELYFFHGCFWHSCPSCYPDRESVHPVKAVTHRENYDQTVAFMTQLRTSGRTVIEQWECSFKQQMTDGDRSVLSRCKAYEPLKPRDAFYGGRCNATTLYASVSRPQDSIKYVDFTSLYPYVNKYACYPTHHPEIYVGSDIPEHVEGLVKCKVLPPPSLYHPVLPYRTRGKLTFPLCRTCVESGIRRPCIHTDVEDRALTGTWVTSELQKACQLGYQILQRYEAWHFPHTSQYSPETRSGGIWASFIDRWVGLKQQASGYPQDVRTAEEKQAYVDDYERHEGIRLDPQKIEKNEGLRSLAKLMANSHWGKSAQQSNKVQVTYVSDPREYVKMMSDRTICVHDAYHVSDEYIALQWSRAEEFDVGLPHTNVVLAAYTTANARLKLYELLERLQERVLYFDTDSVIYLHRDDGSYNPPLGSYLGELKDELPDSRVVEYTGLGPKNYALRMSDGETVCRVRGFSLDYKTSQLVNFETLSSIVLTDPDREIETTRPNAIHRPPRTGEIYTAPLTKRYRMVYDKRLVLEDGIHTVPFGWIGPVFFDDVT